MKLFVIAAIFAVTVFAVQLSLFRKTSKKLLHLIPPMVIGLLYLVALVFFLTDLRSTGGVLMNTLLGWMIVGVNTVALIADGTAWLIEKV